MVVIYGSGGGNGSSGSIMVVVVAVVVSSGRSGSSSTCSSDNSRYLDRNRTAISKAGNPRPPTGCLAWRSRSPSPRARHRGSPGVVLVVGRG